MRGKVEREGRMTTQIFRRIREIISKKEKSPVKMLRLEGEREI